MIARLAATNIRTIKLPASGSKYESKELNLGTAEVCSLN